MRRKKFSPRKSQILQLFTANFNAYPKFTGNFTDVSDRWRSGIGSCWHAGGERFEPVYDSFFFVRSPVNAVKNNFSPLKTAKFTAFNAEKMLAYCGDKSFFSPLFTANLTWFFDRTSTRDNFGRLVVQVNTEFGQSPMHFLLLNSQFGIELNSRSAYAERCVIWILHGSRCHR